MSNNAQQYYNLNEEFQLSTNEQLEDYSSSDYIWTGRTLTSWTDENGQKYSANGSASFDRIAVDLSGNWALNEYLVSASVKSGHGIVRVTSKNSERPLAQTVDKQVDLEDGQTTLIYYDSYLSIDCIPDEDYKTIQFYVTTKGETTSYDTSKQCVFSSKSKDQTFDISCTFVVDPTTACLTLKATNGNLVKIEYDKIAQPLVYDNGTVQTPFSEYSDIASRNTVAEVIDKYDQISVIGDRAFYQCAKLSNIECSSVLSIIGEQAFYQCSISSINFPNLRYIGNCAFQYCKRLSSIDLKEAEVICANVFDHCENLVSASIPRITELNDGIFSYCSNLSSVDCKEVNSIGSQTFYNCTALSTVNFPHLLVIGDRAFYGCTGLISVEFQHITDINRYSFYNCTNLSLALFPNVSSLNNGQSTYPGQAFASCKNLMSVDIHNAKYIGYGSFSDCLSLPFISIPNALNLSNEAFSGCISLASIDCGNVSCIGNKCFKDCSSLISIDLPKNTQLPANAFYGCLSLSNINSKPATSIGNDCFRECSSLISIDLPNVTNISYRAFYDANAMSAANLPSLSAFITGDNYDGYSFCNCDSLVSVFVDNDVMHSIENGYDEKDQLIVDSTGEKLIYGAQGMARAFNNDVLCISDGAFFNHKRLSSVVFNNVLSIGIGAFRSCSNLSNCQFDNVDKIYDRAFYQANGPISAYFPNTLTIERNAFDGNTGIKYAYLPRASSINVSAFFNCSSLVSVYIPQMTQLTSNVFSNCSSLICVDCQNVLSIGEGVFRNCENLLSVNCLNVEIIGGYGNSGYEFANCTALKTIDFKHLKQLGSYNSHIGDKVFYNCSSLTAIDFPELTAFKSHHAFENCSSLISVSMPNVSAIQNFAFKNCANLTSVYIPQVSSIPSEAFRNCINLSSIDFSNITYIDHGAFYNCESLVELLLPNTTTINGYQTGYSSVSLAAFTNCKSLKIVDAEMLSSIENYQFSNCSSLTSINIPNALMIKANAFDGCTSLSSIQFNEVSSIGYKAFQNCSNLQIAYLSNCQTIGGYAFQNCSCLYDVQLQNTIQIKERAFEGCSALTSITLPSITAFSGNYIFRYCSSLSSIVLSDNVNVPSIYNSTFNNIDHIISVYIPNGYAEQYRANSTWKSFEDDEQVVFVETPASSPTKLTLQIVGSSETIELPAENGQLTSTAYANNNDIVKVEIGTDVSAINGEIFANCKNLTELIIPDTVIYSTAGFAGCEKLSSVTIGNNLSCIGDMMFQGCISLSTINIPESVQKIGNNAFSGCNSLSNVNLPNSQLSIMSEAFANCSSITDVEIPINTKHLDNKSFYLSKNISAITVIDGNSNYDSRENCNAAIQSGTNTIVFGCKNTTVPNTIQTIGDYAFAQQINLNDVILPSSVSSIGALAYVGCEGNTLSLSDGLSSIGLMAFSECQQLSSVILPSTLQKIDQYAFRNCTNLSAVMLSSLNHVVTIDNTIFDGIGNLISVYVNANYIDAYQEDEYWQNYQTMEQIVLIGINGGNQYNEESIPTGDVVTDEINSFNYGNDLWW